MTIVHDTCRIDADGERTEGAGRVWPWWSVTKTLIAAIALRLEGEGRVDLDAALDEEGATLADLLSHRAGHPDYGALPAYHADVAAGTPPWTRRRVIEAAGPRRFPPRTGWRYSNIGTMLAREQIERAAGLSLAELLARHVARPLKLASLELATTERFRALQIPNAERYDVGWVYHGCVIGTAADAARAMRACLDGTLLGREATARLTDRLPLGGAIVGRPWSETGYGLGLMTGRMAPVGRAMGHSGAGPQSACAVYHFPDGPGAPTVAAFTLGPDEAKAESLACITALP